MPNSYLTNILFFLKGPFQGNILRTLPFQILFFLSLAVSLACDPSALPRGVRISQSGPVLKLICDPGLQALEMAYSKPSAYLLLPVPSKRKFARYVCLGGTTYQRINAQGIESTFFLCADGKVNRCNPLEHSPDLGHLQVKGTVALWQPVAGGQQSVLYCAHGVWHRLGGGSLPYGVTAKYQQTKQITSTAAISEQTLTSAPDDPSLVPPTTAFATATTTTISLVSSIVGPSHVPYPLLLPPPPRTYVERTTHKRLSLPVEGFIPHSDSIEEPYIPTSNIIVFEGNVAHALNSPLHRFTQMTFYCMLAIGFGAMISGLVLLIRMYRRGTRLAADVVKAQKRLKNTISIV